MECLIINCGKPVIEHLADLYKNQKYFDITMKCSDGTIQAHSLVLRMKSPIWAEEIEQIQGCGNRELVHINISRECMECILEIIYLGIKNVPKQILPEIAEAVQQLKLEGFANEESVKELQLARCKDSISETTVDGLVALKLKEELIQSNVNTDSVSDTTVDGLVALKLKQEPIQSNVNTDSIEPSYSSFSESKNVSPEAIPKKKTKARKFIFPSSSDKDSGETVVALKENNLRKVAAFKREDIKTTCVICYMDFDDILAHSKMHRPVLRKQYECQKCSKGFYTSSFYHNCGKKE